jgi:IS1 family transposase
MGDDLFFYEVLLLALLWLYVAGYWRRPRGRPKMGRATPTPATPPRKRSRDPQPFPGFTHKPLCMACEHAHVPAPQPPSCPSPRIGPTRGGPRQVDTSTQCCPNLDCDDYGWAGCRNLQANGHPSGRPWRQWHCPACGGYFLETHGTPFHGKHVAPDLLVGAVGALAEGLGIRAVARVFEVDPNTVLQWLVEAADHLQVFSQYFLHDVRVTQVQLDELYARLSAVKDGEVHEAEALKRLSHSSHWVWVALDPVSKLLLTIDVGDRTLAVAPGVVHRVVQVLAPGCVPRFLTDGFKEYATALLAQFGQWVQPPRRQATGPVPKPRWMPWPQLLYAQVIKVTRRRRLVRVSHRVVFGALAAVEQVRAAQSWHINTAFIERINLTIRQHVAAVGRRVMTLCKGEEGLRQQLALYHTSYNFCRPHTSLRLPLPPPFPTNGTGSAKTWRPRTPAMAAGLTDRVWTLREVLLYRVPPWPQPQTL